MSTTETKTTGSCCASPRCWWPTHHCDVSVQLGSSSSQINWKEWQNTLPWDQGHAYSCSQKHPFLWLHCSVVQCTFPSRTQLPLRQKHLPGLLLHLQSLCREALSKFLGKSYFYTKTCKPGSLSGNQSLKSIPSSHLYSPWEILPIVISSARLSFPPTHRSSWATVSNLKTYWYPTQTPNTLFP